jgi:hypothetical protein
MLQQAEQVQAEMSERLSHAQVKLKALEATCQSLLLRQVTPTVGGAPQGADSCSGDRAVLQENYDPGARLPLAVLVTTTVSLASGK